MSGKHIFSDNELFRKLMLILLIWEREEERKEKEEGLSMVLNRKY